MKRAQRTTITWRFENPMAPNGKNYLPIQRNGTSLVLVVVTIFQGKAKFRVWLTNKVLNGGHLANAFRFYFFGSPGSREWTESLGLMPDYGDDHDKEAVGANGDAVHVDFVFHAKNGESVTHAACRIFVAFCDEFAVPEERVRYFLPTPEIVQETMVEAYCEDNWITYGEDMWQRHFSPNADAVAAAKAQ